MGELRAFSSALRRNWVAPVSGGLGVVFAAIGLWGPASLGSKWLFVACGVLGLVVAAFTVWRAEYQRANAALADVAALRAAMGGLSPADKALDERVAGKVAILSEPDRRTLFKMVIEGESPAGGVFQEIANRTDMFVRAGATLRTKDGFKEALRRWADKEAQRSR
jgi:hypothetical protein